MSAEDEALRIKLHEIEFKQDEILKELGTIKDRLVEAEKLTKGVIGLYTTLKVVGSIAGVVGALIILWKQYTG